MATKHHTQIAILGSGFGGSLMAMAAKRLGFSTVLIERGRHPRFAIGESSTPLTNLLLEEIAIEYELPFVRPLCKWGSWQRQLPNLAGGIKRGFTFYHHELGKPFGPDLERRCQLLVGASPNEEIADTHWYRQEFDEYLARQAQGLGVAFWEETELENAFEEAEGIRLTGKRQHELVEIQAEFVIDATGPRGFLQRALGLPEKPLAGFPRTQGLFTHFRKVGPLPKSFSVQGKKPPYPPEQAAVHHVFPGGWVWVLKFNNGITSAGVAATDLLAEELDFRSGEAAWRRLLERLPSLREVFGQAETIMPFVHSPRLPFQTGRASGANWALLPSAAGFVDPLLSTGFPLTLLGVKRMGELLKSSWKQSDFREKLDEYAKITALELETTAELVGSLYATLDRFDLFKELSRLYFAAASFSEMARRLGKPQLADGFLLCCQPDFARQLQEICEAAHPTGEAGDLADLASRVKKTIAPFDVAGLTEESRDPWYPAAAADLLRNRGKVGATEAEMKAMLRRCGVVV